MLSLIQHPFHKFWNFFKHIQQWIETFSRVLEFLFNKVPGTYQFLQRNGKQSLGHEWPWSCSHALCHLWRSLGCLPLGEETTTTNKQKGNVHFRYKQLNNNNIINPLTPGRETISLVNCGHSEVLDKSRNLHHMHYYWVTSPFILKFVYHSASFTILQSHLQLLQYKHQTAFWLPSIKFLNIAGKVRLCPRKWIGVFL